MLVSILISFMFFSISFFFAWMKLGNDRFQIYNLYSNVEESLRKIFLSFGDFECCLKFHYEWNENDRSKFIQELAREAHEGLFSSGVRCNEFRELKNLIIRMIRGGLRFEKSMDGIDYVLFAKEDLSVSKNPMTRIEFDEILREGREMVGKMLEVCGDEKKKFEGCFKGNWRSFCLLFHNKQLDKNEILQIAHRRAAGAKELAKIA